MPVTESLTGSPVDSLAHLIQIALTPVFLLSGIAALLNVFSTRLARVSDRCHAVTMAIEAASAGPKRRALEGQFAYLHRRSRLLDGAVLLGTAAGGATCAAALLLFVGSLRDTTVASLLYLSFGLALLCTAGALLAFLTEVLLASRGMRERQAAAVRHVLSQEHGDADAESEQPDQSSGGPAADGASSPAAE